jgi:virginiamycin B lyase
MLKTGLITITSILLTIFIMLSYAPIFNGSATAIAPSSIENSASPIANNFSIKEYQVPPGTHPHDVAPMISNQDNNTIVWFTAQATGQLGKLDKTTGQTHLIPLGQGSAPHGVIIGPDDAPWITDGGLNAIVRVDPKSEEVKIFSLPGGGSQQYANLNTATFDKEGALWFTGQSGIHGKLNTSTGQIKIFDAPKGPGPYGITTTPNGTVYFASLAGSYIAKINPTKNDSAIVIEPPTPDQGARRVWSDSQGKIWISEWNSGKLGMYNPSNNKWKEWKLPGENPMPYAVYVDQKDIVWLTDFGSNAFVRFDPTNETFTVIKIPSAGANVRQILGIQGEIWGAESGTDKIISIKTGGP